MKRFVLFSFLAVALAFSMAQANAGPIVVNVSLDEFGNGTSDGAPLNSFVTTDITGGAASALFYQLPFSAVSGDLYLNDSATAVVLGDVLRFFNVGNTSYVAFYSDNGDGVDATADISGLPQNTPFANIVTISEVGPEGANGAVYTPGSGDPGFISTDFAATYTILSDSTAPEPGSVLLIAAGLAGLGLLKHYRR